MRFWDSSAIVPLLVTQPGSARVAAWAAEDNGLMLWTLTPVEVASALSRLNRDGRLSEELTQTAEARLDHLLQMCHAVQDVEPVKRLARRLLRVHPLRAFDALQLGAALHWVEGHPHGRTFHTLDARLALAARREGFVVP